MKAKGFLIALTTMAMTASVSLKDFNLKPPFDRDSFGKGSKKSGKRKPTARKKKGRK